MAIIIRAKGADWSGKGFPNINPFVATNDLIYGFDLKDRSSKFEDLTGNHTITPYSNDGAGGPVTPDSGIAVTTADGLGVRVEQGLLVSSLNIPTISASSSPFTIMVVASDSGVDSAHDGAILFDLGYGITHNGIGVVRLRGSGANVVQIESGVTNLTPVPETINKLQASVFFITYDGTTNWASKNKTTSGAASGTNASLSVGSPMSMLDGLSLGKVYLGGNTRNNTELYANYPNIYQQAMWNKVLSPAEIEEQYARCKASRPTLNL